MWSGKRSGNEDAPATTPVAEKPITPRPPTTSAGAAMAPPTARAAAGRGLSETQFQKFGFFLGSVVELEGGGGGVPPGPRTGPEGGGDVVLRRTFILGNADIEWFEEEVERLLDVGGWKRVCTCRRVICVTLLLDQ